MVKWKIVIYPKAFRKIRMECCSSHVFVHDSSKWSSTSLYSYMFRNSILGVCYKILLLLHIPTMCVCVGAVIYVRDSYKNATFLFLSVRCVCVCETIRGKKCEEKCWWSRAAMVSTPLKQYIHCVPPCDNVCANIFLLRRKNTTPFYYSVEVTVWIYRAIKVCKHFIEEIERILASYMVYMPYGMVYMYLYIICIAYYADTDPTRG